ncbi:MAG TPA: phosphoribosylformylglycinamidine synthase subunit PurL [Candidatus Limnocylindrales bacterium]|nr:phosphoribosylformylglycinamidine synthase subunit PurL [Candidatus Limnocylindrales bacterium]
MTTRIGILSIGFDARAQTSLKKLQNLGYKDITDLWIIDGYTVDKSFSQKELEQITSKLSNPVTQEYILRTAKTRVKPKKKFAYVIEIGFLPGVTDNISHTAKEIIEDGLKVKFTESEGIYSSQITFLEGKLSRKDAEQIAFSMHNPLIQRSHIKSYSEFITDGGMDVITPKVKIVKKPQVDLVDLNVSDEELTNIGKSGIKNKDGSRRGPLALDLTYMKTVQKYFKKEGRKPTDIELESLAQTWSEHCKHTIFADPIDEIKDGLYKTYIKKATEVIRKKKGKDDFCVSVFTDNSGAIAFDDKHLITHKVETHNSPSALDPFGGAITGIVGVNRDTIGFGMGAKPVANFYGFCLADPRVDTPLFRDPELSNKMLSSRRIMDGVIDGVNAGGNQSGIPTPQGFVYFDERYRGKPLVFAGTVGLIPRKIKNKLSHLKKALPGDLIVMIGGRVGKDGIHGATFSSEIMDSNSPAAAVQIGDPITQKKLSDAIVKEARDLLLYNSITDDGAGGLSCSIAEMAKESNGCVIDLEKAPLKYAGLEPWEIWISESQERMTLAVPKKNWKKLESLMTKRGVEATVIGEFTKSGRCVVNYNTKTVVDIDLDFLHYGLPKRQLVTKESRIKKQELRIKEPKNLNQTLTEMLSRLNMSSFEFISQQYDHIVQGNFVLGPLQGRGRINSDSSIIRPVLSSSKGVVLSQALYPRYSEIDPYLMSACAIDTAIRNAVATGADPDRIALLDNFCWCSSNEPERLSQLKQAAKACYDFAVSYGTPFISGKDSMFNDFKGYDKNGEAIQISVPPTLLISSIGIIDDITKTVSLDAKIEGDLVYLLGDTNNELSESEYLAMNNATGSKVPVVDSDRNKKMYHAFYKAVQKNLIASSISIGRGGLAIALTKKAIGGGLGINISLKEITGNVSRDDFALYSESQGRMLVTIEPNNKINFEKAMNGNKFKLIGKITKEQIIRVNGLEGNEVLNVRLEDAAKAYRKTFKDY